MSSNDPGHWSSDDEDPVILTTVVAVGGGSRTSHAAAYRTPGSSSTRNDRRIHAESTRPQPTVREGEQRLRHQVPTDRRATLASARAVASTATTAPRTPTAYESITRDNRPPQTERTSTSYEAAIPQLQSKTVGGRSEPSGALLLSPSLKRHATAPFSVIREAQHKAPAKTATSGGSAVPDGAQAGMPVSSLSVTARNAARVLEGITKDSDHGQHSKGDRNNKVTDWGLYLPLCSNDPADAKAIHGRYIYSGNATLDTWGGPKSMRPTSPFAAALEEPLSVTLRPVYKDTLSAARTAVSQALVPTGRNPRESHNLYNSHPKEDHHGKYDAQRHGGPGNGFPHTTTAHVQVPAQQPAQNSGRSGPAARGPVLSLDGRSSHSAGQGVEASTHLPVGVLATGMNTQYPAHIASYAPPQFRNIAPTSAGQAMKTPVSYTPSAGTSTHPGHMRGGAQVPSYSAASGSGSTVARPPVPSSSAGRRPHAGTVMTYQFRHCAHPPFIILNHARVHVESHYGPVNAGRVFVDEEHIKFIQQPVYD